MRCKVTYMYCMLISCTELLILTLDARDFYGVCCNYKYQYCMKICSLR